MALIAKRQKRDLPPEGVYPATVASIDKDTHDEYGEQIRFSFDLLDHFQEDGNPTRVFRTCSYNFSPQSALTGVVQDTLGRSLSADEAFGGFDLETLVDFKVQVVVKHKDSAAGNTYAKVDTIIHMDKDTAEAA